MADIDNPLGTATGGSNGSPGLSGGTSSAGAAVQPIVDEQLAPLTARIDREGYYPEQVLRALGEAGAYRHHLASQNPAGACDLAAAIDAMRVVSQQCLSTGFMMWCQNALGWYLENSVNSALKGEQLPTVAGGTMLGGTALSNPMKHFSGIEPLQLKAETVAGGVVINGTLPWVSNLGTGHCFAAICQVEQDPARNLMVLVPCDSENLGLTQLAHFSGMEGTGTYACQFKGVFVPDELVIADEVGPYIQRIKAGFILLQAGMAAGLVESCIGLMDEVEPALGHVNCYLDDRPADLLDEVEGLKGEVAALASDPFNDSKEYIQDVIHARLFASDLALRAANAAMLHTGARGYLIDAPAQRKLREAYFVAIVTPAIKHLRKELDMLAAN